VSWSLRFEQPIPVADGRRLVSLRDAIKHRGEPASFRSDKAGARWTSRSVDQDHWTNFGAICTENGAREARRWSKRRRPSWKPASNPIGASASL